MSDLTNADVMNIDIPWVDKKKLRTKYEQDMAVEMARLPNDHDKFAVCKSWGSSNISKDLRKYLEIMYPGKDTVVLKRNKSILHIDMNSLYPTVMSLRLPSTVPIEHQQDEPAAEFPGGSFYEELMAKLQTYDLYTSSVGYSGIVDVECPPSEHWRQLDLPGFPTMGEIEFKDLSSEDQLNYIKRYKRPPANGKLGKRMALSLKPKQDYGIHIALLQRFLTMGWTVTRVRRYYSYEQERVLADWMTHHRDKRSRSEKHSLGEMMAKNMLNIIYGKCCEILSNRQTLDFIRDEEKAKKVCKESKKRNSEFQIVSENAPVVQTLYQQKRVVLNRPVYFGACILDLSKLYMYNWFYDHLKRMFPKSTLCYMDTDSFIVEVEHSCDMNDILKDNGHLFDFHNLPKYHFLYDDSRKEVFGLMKMENIDIEELIALQSKVYHLTLGPGSMRDNDDQDSINKAKGHPKGIVSEWDACVYRSGLIDWSCYVDGDGKIRLANKPGQIRNVTRIQKTRFQQQNTIVKDNRQGLTGLNTKAERIGPFAYVPYGSVDSFVQAIDASMPAFKKCPPEVQGMIREYAGSDKMDCVSYALKLLSGSI